MTSSVTVETSPSQEEIRWAKKFASVEVKPKVLPLKYFPDPVLRQESEEVTEFGVGIEFFAGDLLRTMMHHHGVGLAAPQVGRPIRMFVVDVVWIRGLQQRKRETDPHVFINPVVTPVGVQRTEAEGCLSFPGVRLLKTRSTEIHVRAQDPYGNWFELHPSGFFARAIQHEYDHLNGVTFEPHLTRTHRQAMRKARRKK